MLKVSKFIHEKQTLNIGTKVDVCSTTYSIPEIEQDRRRSMPKLSRSCRKILEVMNYNELYSAQQIHARMRAADPKAPGLSTTYRSLEILLRDKYLQAIDLGDGERRYELVRPGEHHHHLICEACGTSIHMDECAIDQLNAKISAAYGFHIEQHVLEIFGRCKSCASKE